MSPGATFERVYRAIKAEIGSGRFPPGAPLEPAMLSDEFNASITPVRDALHRLVGEGLVDAPRGDGFRTPPMTEVGYRHLLGWSRWLLLGAIRKRPRHGGIPAQAADSPQSDLESKAGALFFKIAAWSGNPEHVDAVARLNQRLAAARMIERQVLHGIEAELTDIERALELERERLRVRIVSYHRRRLKGAAEIVAALHNS